MLGFIDVCCNCLSVPWFLSCHCTAPCKNKTKQNITDKTESVVNTSGWDVKLGPYVLFKCPNDVFTVVMGHIRLHSRNGCTYFGMGRVKLRLHLSYHEETCVLAPLSMFYFWSPCVSCWRLEPVLFARLWVRHSWQKTAWWSVRAPQEREQERLEVPGTPPCLFLSSLICKDSGK